MLSNEAATSVTLPHRSLPVLSKCTSQCCTQTQPPLSPTALPVCPCCTACLRSRMDTPPCPLTPPVCQNDPPVCQNDPSHMPKRPFPYAKLLHPHSPVCVYHLDPLPVCQFLMCVVWSPVCLRCTCALPSRYNLRECGLMCMCTCAPPNFSGCDMAPRQIVQGVTWHPAFFSGMCTCTPPNFSGCDMAPRQIVQGVA